MNHCELFGQMADAECQMANAHMSMGQYSKGAQIAAGNGEESSRWIGHIRQVEAKRDVGISSDELSISSLDNPNVWRHISCSGRISKFWAKCSQRRFPKFWENFQLFVLDYFVNS
jgi:hypothetical protein